MDAAMNQNRMAVATPQPAAPMAGSPNLPNTKMMLSGTLSASPTNPATMAGRVLPWPSRKQRCTTKNMSAGTPQSTAKRYSDVFCASCASMVPHWTMVPLMTRNTAMSSTEMPAASHRP